MHLALCIAAGSTVALTACSGDDGGGNTEAFCEELEQLAASTDDTTDAEDLAILQAIADVAPSEVSGAMDELVNVFEQLQSFDPESATDDEMADFLALADGVDQAGAELEAFATENCPDLPADIFDQ
jgi:hypothetical protein